MFCDGVGGAKRRSLGSERICCDVLCQSMETRKTKAADHFFNMSYDPSTDPSRAKYAHFHDNFMQLPTKMRAELVLETIFDESPLPLDSEFYKPHLVGDIVDGESPYYNFKVLFDTCYVHAPSPAERGKAVTIFQTRIDDVVTLLGALITGFPTNVATVDYPRAVRIKYCLDFLNAMITFPSCRRKMHRNKDMPGVIKQCIGLTIPHPGHTNFFHIPRNAIQIAWGVCYLMTKYITCGKDMTDMIDRYTRDAPGQTPAGVDSNGKIIGFIVGRIEAYTTILKKSGHNRPALSSKKIKPNAPCPCNSKKKYKKCCQKMVDRVDTTTDPNDGGMWSVDVSLPSVYHNNPKAVYFLKGGVAHADELYNTMWKMLVHLPQTGPKDLVDSMNASSPGGSFVDEIYETMKLRLREEKQKTTVVTATMCEAGNCNNVEENDMMDESGTFKKCSRCGAKYCCVACQTWDWKKGGHKKVCRKGGKSGGHGHGGGNCTTKEMVAKKKVAKKKKAEKKKKQQQQSLDEGDFVETFVVGQEAMVHGLTSEAGMQLNGEQVVVLSALDPQNGRYSCLVATVNGEPVVKGGELKLVKAVNLAKTFRGTEPVMPPHLAQAVLKKLSRKKR